MYKENSNLQQAALDTEGNIDIVMVGLILFLLQYFSLSESASDTAHQESPKQRKFCQRFETTKITPGGHNLVLCGCVQRALPLPTLIIFILNNSYYTQSRYTQHNYAFK